VFLGSKKVAWNIIIAVVKDALQIYQQKIVVRAVIVRTTKGIKRENGICLMTTQ
jgi:ribosomal protein L14